MLVNHSLWLSKDSPEATGPHWTEANLSADHVLNKLYAGKDFTRKDFEALFECLEYDHCITEMHGDRENHSVIYWVRDKYFRIDYYIKKPYNWQDRKANYIFDNQPYEVNRVEEDEYIVRHKVYYDKLEK